MPGSIRTFDATSQRYHSDSDDDLPLHTGKPILYNLALRSQVSVVNLPPSPADSELAEMQIRDDTTAEERRLTRAMDRGAPGDRLVDTNTPEQKDLAKRKSQYYQEQFAYREVNSSAKERVSKESMIVADVRTNVIVSIICETYTE